MEIILNLAWALFSAGLIWFWLRCTAENPAPRRTQIMALMIVILLLLPVISLSDDLVAAQGPAEVGSGLRRALASHESLPSVVPASLALLEPLIANLLSSGPSLDALKEDGQTSSPSFLPRSLDNRPPPRA